MLIRNGLVYCEDFMFHWKNIYVENGVIRELIDNDGDDYGLDSRYGQVLDAEGMYVLPGLTDLHFHGAVGEDVSDGDPAGLTRIAQYEYEHGVTQICPATMTVSEEKILAACQTAAELHRKQRLAMWPGGGGMGVDRTAQIVGLHLEGPFLSPERAGAQNSAYLRKPDPDLIRRCISASNGLVKTVTIAPELDGAIDCIKELKKRIAFSIGHTTADYDMACKAFQAGAVRLTHTFNAMPPFLHRDPGPVGAASETEEVSAECIGDGVHLHPSTVRALFRLFGPERVILISDSIRGCGMPDGHFCLGGQPVIKKYGEIRLPNGVLAGSAVNLYDCMVRTIHMGIRPEDAVRAAAYNPAAALGIDDRYGSIAPGKAANLLLARQNFQLERVL